MKQNSEDDLQADKNLRRIDELEAFRKEFQGKEFEKKVLEAVKESHPIREELKSITWETVKNKIVWIIIGGVSVIFIDLLIRAIPSILKAISNGQ